MFAPQPDDRSLRSNGSPGRRSQQPSIAHDCRLASIHAAYGSLEQRYELVIENGIPVEVPRDPLPELIAPIAAQKTPQSLCNQPRWLIEPEVLDPLAGDLTKGRNIRAKDRQT